MDSSSTSSFSPPPSARRVEVRRNILRIAAFLLGALLIDVALGGLLQSASMRFGNGEALEHVNFAATYRGGGIVVFGNSRAKFHVDPQVLSDRTGLSVYNAGADGQGIYFHRAVQELLLQQPAQAKLFVLQVDATDISAPLSVARSLVLAPFMERSAEVRNIVLRCDVRAWIKQFSMTWRFNSLIHQFSLVKRSESVRGNSFRPLDGTMDQRLIDAETQRMCKNKCQGVSPDEAGATLQMYRDFIRRTHDNNIEIVLFMGPRLLRQSDLEVDALASLMQLAADNNIPLLRFEEGNCPALRDPTVYCDINHLNGRGAALLTGLLSDYICEFRSTRGQTPAHLNQVSRPEDPLR